MPTGGVMLAGRYRLRGLIAAGGVGEVWRAEDLVLGRAVAVKLLRPQYASHPETLARFQAEARHAGGLTHPGIAQVYDFGEACEMGPPYLVMELVTGRSLARVLAAGPLDPARAMDVVAQTAAGLAAAHVAGLLHRDIKPANLLLGPGGVVKITDFGIAHAAGSAPLTATGMVVGTPAYLAPERAAGCPATPASDLYSLGVVAYECLTGAPPFTGPPLDMAAAHRDRPLPPLPAAVPAGVATLVRELTAKDPAARPASAGAVATRAGELKDALPNTPAGQPGTGRYMPTAVQPALEQPTLTEVPLPPPGLRRQRRLPTRPRRGLVLALAATAVAAGLTGWLLAGASGPVPPQQHPSAAPTAASGPAQRMVTVNGAALAGRPASTVRQLLRQLGLAPRVVWVPAAGQPPGTVVSVQPTGPLPPGTTVTVTAAYRPHRHQHGNSQGNGNGD